MTRSMFAGVSALLLAFITSFTLGAGRSDIADAAMKGDKASLKTLIQQKADVNATQIDGATALHWAVYKGDVEMLDTLIGAGARVDVANREGVTPLHMASLYGNVAIIDRLVKAGANAKQKGPAGETMLMLAARNGNRDVIKRSVLKQWPVNAARAGVDPDPEQRDLHRLGLHFDIGFVGTARDCADGAGDERSLWLRGASG